MRKVLTTLLIMVSGRMSLLHAQAALVAADSSGCDSLQTNIYFQPSSVYDTVSSISWILDGELLMDDSDTLSLSLSSPSGYSLSALLNGNAGSTFTLPLVVYESPDAGFIARDTIGDNPYSYYFSWPLQSSVNASWSFEWVVEGLTAGIDPNLVYAFGGPGNYSVQLNVTDNNSCTGTSAQTITARELLRCPNVFTPNYDGRNDVFVVSTDGITLYSFCVYSRAGIKVYQTESPQIRWDGRSLSGVEMQPGVYYYTIEEVGGQGESRNGFVHILR